MMLAVVRAVADWLEHGTHGVNAKLAALTFDGADVAPVGTVLVIDETRDDDAPLGRDGTRPFIRVSAGEVSSLAGESAMTTHEADVPLQLVLVRSDPSPAALSRDLYYTLRAIVQSVEALFNDTIAAAITARSRNGVQLQVTTSMSFAQVRTESGDTPGTGAVLVTIRCRDTLA